MGLVVMTKKNLIRFAVGFVFCVSLRPVSAEVDYGSLIQGDEAVLHTEKYGCGKAMVVSNGYLFVDFKYLPSPYTIRRIGQAVVVNNIVVNCLYKRDIPEKYEDYDQKVKDSSGKEHVWRSPPHPSSNIMKTADFWVGMLPYWLESKAVFLSKSCYVAMRNLQRPINDTELEKCLPKVLAVNCEEFSTLLKVTLDIQSLAQATELFKTNYPYSKLPEEYLSTFIENVRRSQELKERLRKENSLPQQTIPKQ